ncbi:cytochrome P450, partial [Citrobacter sp. AAK_AS5]
IAERRKRPTDDLISTLIRAEQGEGTLTEGEVLAFSVLLLVAGNETTTNLLGNALLALTEHPAELSKVVKRPELIEGLVE